MFHQDQKEKNDIYQIQAFSKCPADQGHEIPSEVQVIDTCEIPQNHRLQFP